MAHIFSGQFRCKVIFQFKITKRDPKKNMGTSDMVLIHNLYSDMLLELFSLPRALLTTRIRGDKYGLYELQG